MSNIYIQRQPSHILLSIVRIQGEPDIKKIEHESLGELEKVSDILFIFSQTPKTISRKKFTSLYQGCGWVNVNKSLPETIMDVFEYDQEIFEGHSGILYVNLEDLEKINTSDISRLPLILGSTINGAILEVSRLDAPEFKEIYTEEPKPFWKTWNLRRREENNDGMYCIYKSSSPIILFPSSAIQQEILRFWKADGESYIRSFRNFDPHYLFASILMKLGIKIVGRNFNELGI